MPTLRERLIAFGWWPEPRRSGHFVLLDHTVVKEQDALIDAMYTTLTTSRMVKIGPRKREEIDEIMRRHRSLRHLRWPPTRGTNGVQ